MGQASACLFGFLIPTQSARAFNVSFAEQQHILFRAVLSEDLCMAKASVLWLFGYRKCDAGYSKFTQMASC